VPFPLSRPRFGNTLSAVIVVVLVVLLPGWVVPAQAATTTSGHLSGTVRKDDSEVISNARVRLLAPASGTEMAATTTGSSGRYSLDVAVGTYDLVITAGSGSDLNTAVVRDMAVSDGHTMFDVVVVPPKDEPTFTGRIIDESGAPLPYQAHLYLQATYGTAGEADTAADGTFTLHAPHGTYGLGVNIIAGRSTPDSPYVYLDLRIPNFDLTQDRTETLTIPMVDLDAHVTTDSGAPGGYVYSGCDQCHLPGPVIRGTTSQVTFRSDGSADSTGTTHLKALASTNTWIHVMGSDTLYPVERTNVAAPAAAPITIDQPEIDPATKVTFGGALTDQHGHPLDGYVTLEAGSFQKEVEVSGGGFELSVPRGRYQLKLRVNVGTVWVQLGMESGDYTEGLFVTLDDIDLTTDRTQNLTVPIVDFPVQVLDAAGQPTGASVSGTSGDTPGQYGEGNAAVELFPGGVGHGMLDNEATNTDASGIAHLQSFPGAAPPVVTASQGFASGQATPTATATTATVKLSSSVANVNGTIANTSGPLTDQVRVDIAGYDLTTGPWGLSAPAGHYPFRVGYPYDDYDDSINHVPGPTRPAYWWVDGTIVVAGDTTVNLTLPDADHADVYLYGEGGRPAWQGATTTADTVGASVVLAPGMTATGHAQSDATTDIGHIRAPMFGPSNVSLFPSDWIYTTPLAKFALKPNDTIHVLSAVHGSQPALDTGPAPSTPTTTTPTTPITPTTSTTLPLGAEPAPGATKASNPSGSGYWALGSDGHVYDFGDAPALSNGTAGAVDLESTPTGKGYWILSRNGSVQPFGDAVKLGDVDTAKLAKGEEPASLSATPTAKGYWVFTNRGRAIPFGDAPFLGDMSGTKLNGPVLGSVATPTGKGYYMVASDGGIFAFGNATFAGSMGGKKLNAPVQSLVPNGDGQGYWLVASDGGIFAFDAPFRGSMGATKLNKPVVGMVRYGDGYLMVGADGGIFNFSSSPFAGSLGDQPPATPVVAVAALP
jgi:hypothetical protein